MSVGVGGWVGVSVSLSHDRRGQRSFFKKVSRYCVMVFLSKCNNSRKPFEGHARNIVKWHKKCSSK